MTASDLEPGVADTIAAQLGASVIQAIRVHGGDVARAHRLSLDDGRTVFAKTHHAPPPGFFVTEAIGLTWLAEAGAVRVPRVLGVGEEPAFLALEWIEVGNRVAGNEGELGRSLAALHRAGAPSFGREDRRTTGSRALPNDPCSTWAEFYADRRLRPLADLAQTERSLPEGVVSRALGRVADRLDDLVGPQEPPARLHGDLWGGNRLIDRSGSSWLIDPASFGGHREFDLAMMRLFGGFTREVFEAYHEAFPLAPGWRDRVALCQIAPLVVHAIKFGGGYVAAATDAIATYA